MATDPKAYDRAALGARCRELLKSETFLKAVEGIDKEYRDAVFRTGIGDTEKREGLFREYTGFKRIVARLRTWEEDGVLAQAELDRERKEVRA